jgi:hypothetical protein
VDEAVLQPDFDRVPPTRYTIIAPLLHTHLSPPHEMSDKPDQTAHYYHVDAGHAVVMLFGTNVSEEKNIFIFKVPFY